MNCLEHCLYFQVFASAVVARFQRGKEALKSAFQIGSTYSISGHIFLFLSEGNASNLSRFVCCLSSRTLLHWRIASFFFFDLSNPAITVLCLIDLLDAVLTV